MASQEAQNKVCAKWERLAREELSMSAECLRSRNRMRTSEAKEYFYERAQQHQKRAGLCFKFLRLLRIKYSAHA